MNRHTIRWAGVAAAGIMLATSAARAQQPQPLRIRGVLEKADLPSLEVKARDGQTVSVKVADNVRVTGMSKAALSDIKPNSFIGITAMPLPDGSQRAIAIHIFMES